MDTVFLKNNFFLDEIIDFYKRQINKNSFDIPWLLKLQKDGLEKFIEYKFFVNLNNDWKFSLVESFLKYKFLGLVKNDCNMQNIFISNFTLCNLKINIGNGYLLNNQKDIDKYLPDNVLFMPLFEAIKKYPQKVQPYLSKIFKCNNSFHALNIGLLNSGFLLYIPSFVQLKEPISIFYTQDKDNQIICGRNIIVLEKGSELSLLECYSGDNKSCYTTNSVTEIYMNENSKFFYYKCQRDSNRSFHINHFFIKQKRESVFEHHSLNFGGKLVRNSINVYLDEEKSRCLLNGIYVIKKKQDINNFTIVHHNVSQCESEQNHRGVLFDNSRAVFNDKVIISKYLKFNVAKQYNKNLLLSDNAKLHTSPQLNILTNDIFCSHGATVGKIDDDALFYLLTRGIKDIMARDYLIQAFIKENFQLISNQYILDWFYKLIDIYI
ncbi:Fe-S cluster assembly protein SufD [Candidatus Legionella polyplacis]|uniref:Fe-S cluster assembly protein SufD n=1 Tax=Candidatus Legionella polyplacis TaxID=2005262 RepID=UPI000C1F1F87|nr:Fe-S cluster assembly protein SufD [Candidatus Legionella polyplacis]ATW01846.1 Fe-S cluster assembly protein SufD [Candidatus Legionella polyplacis]